MKAYVITLQHNQYSENVANRCIQSAAKHGEVIEKFYGVDKTTAEEVMKFHGLSWGWANNNTETFVCSKTKLLHFPYKTSDLKAKIGCSMSHYLLWRRCVELNEPIAIFEHDSVFLRPIPKTLQFKGICQLNDPNGATRRGNWWSNEMKKRGGQGVFEKTWVTTIEERHIPDGLAGNSAYVIKPWAAQELIDKYHELGVWPNDAIMCKQLFPYLEEIYPFVTMVKQAISTSTT